MAAEEGDGEPKKENKSSLQNQIIACFICNMGSFSFGSAMSWLSPVTQQLRAMQGGPLSSPLTEAQLGWAGALVTLGALLGQPLVAVVANTKGRKPAAYLAGVPLALGFILKYFARSAYVLLCARLLCGVGGAASLALPPLYCGEVASPRARGALVALSPLLYSLGALSTHLLASAVSYRTLTLLLALPPLLFMLAFWFVPESPMFRMRQGKEEEAARAVAWLHKLPLNGVQVRVELIRMARQLRAAHSQEEEMCEPTKENLTREMEWLRHGEGTKKTLHRPSPWRMLFCRRVGLLGFGLCLCLFSSQSLLGVLAISVYTGPIFQAAGSQLSPSVCAMAYCGVMVLGSLAASLLMDKAGRRVLQISTCLIVGGSQALLAWYMQAIGVTAGVELGTSGALPPMGTSEAPGPLWLANLTWLPLAMLAVTVFFFNVGAGNMPFIIVSEIFSAEVRDLATSLSLSYMWLISSLLLQLFPPAVSAVGLHKVFYFFATMCVFSALLFHFILPETKGKTQEEILKLLESKKHHQNAKIDDNNEQEMHLKS